MFYFLLFFFYFTLFYVTFFASAQIQAVFSQAAIVPKLVSLLSSPDKDITKEAAWALANATSGGTPEQNKYLNTDGCFLIFF
jgi:importin subunit alpha-1